MCELPKFIGSNAYVALVAFTSPCMDMSGFESFKYFNSYFLKVLVETCTVVHKESVGHVSLFIVKYL